MLDKKNVNVVIVGMGRIGATFLSKLTEKSELGVSILAVVESDMTSPGVEVATMKHIEIFSSIDSLVKKIGENVDVIFDLTGSKMSTDAVRVSLQNAGNKHTVLVPEIVAFLFWDVMGADEEFLSDRVAKGY